MPGMRFGSVANVRNRRSAIAELLCDAAQHWQSRCPRFFEEILLCVQRTAQLLRHATCCGYAEKETAHEETRSELANLRLHCLDARGARRRDRTALVLADSREPTARDRSRARCDWRRHDHSGVDRGTPRCANG